ncbi:hypothetical protein EDC04DRAFT_2598894 [Pisolithus marmoratus]|nr:hypothetical protein EDC04DRAFT_2598894 [Pisolithus marmoratus]
MTSGKLPNYRHSYLLRFHPYARFKPPSRERVMLHYGSPLGNVDNTRATVYATEEDGLPPGEEHFTWSFQSSVAHSVGSQRLSISTLVLVGCMEPNIKWIGPSADSVANHPLVHLRLILVKLIFLRTTNRPSTYRSIGQPECSIWLRDTHFSRTHYDLAWLVFSNSGFGSFSKAKGHWTHVTQASVAL